MEATELRFSLLEMAWKLRAECGFVEPNDGRLAVGIVDGDNVETPRTSLNVTPAKKIVASANVGDGESLRRSQRGRVLFAGVGL
jgi:hypothetical protein